MQIRPNGGKNVQCRKLKGQVTVIPWQSSGWDSMLSLPRVWVWSLVRELRVHQLIKKEKNLLWSRWQRGDKSRAVMKEDITREIKWCSYNIIKVLNTSVTQVPAVSLSSDSCVLSFFPYINLDAKPKTSSNFPRQFTHTKAVFPAGGANRSMYEKYLTRWHDPGHGDSKDHALTPGSHRNQ